ncbi:MAG TPA: hypothetical protein G4N93_04890 [Dehalococcoidia bacterium]|nr:hypothetical protein [Dehalococcoidia bacterium]
MRNADKLSWGSTSVSFDRILSCVSERGTEMYAISKEEINEIVSNDGEARGILLYTDAEYIRRHEGEKTLRRVEEATEEMGYPIDYGKVKLMDWYPIGLRLISLLAITKVLNWDDEQLKEMGRSAPKYSIITKLMLRYFVSLGTLVERVQTYWDKNYTVGSITGSLIDKSVFICLKSCHIPRLLFPYLEGYFVGAMGLVIGNHKQIRLEETKWMHRDGRCHEFVLRW